MPDFRCSHCNSAVRDCITHYINDAGDLYKVPTKVCTNEQCLMKQGATVIRKEKREYPSGALPPLDPRVDLIKPA